MSDIKYSFYETSSGYKVSGKDNTFILLAGGGTIATSAFASIHNHDDRYYTEYETDVKFVPYTGAYQDLNMGGYGGTFNSIKVGHQSASYIGLSAPQPISVFNGGQAQGMLMRSLLLSDSYTNSVDVPNVGLYSTGSLIVKKWATTIIDGDNITIRKPDFAGGGWARNLLQFQAHDGTLYYTIGAQGGGNIYSGGYLSTPQGGILEWFPDRTLKVNTLAGFGTRIVTVNSQGILGTDVLSSTNNFLPLTGGNLTGNLTGTNAYFSSKVGANSGFYQTTWGSHGSVNIRTNPTKYTHWGGITGAVVFELPVAWQWFPAHILLRTINSQYQAGSQFLSINTYSDGKSWGTGEITNNTVNPNVVSKLRLGLTPTGKACIVINDINTIWEYPLLTIEKYTGGSMDMATGDWTSYITTDLTGYDLAERPLITALNTTSLNQNLVNYYTKSQALGLFVGLTGVQTIADTKTFTSSPIVPTATLANHVVNLEQLNTKSDVGHAHMISDVTGLQNALDGKVNNSQVLTDVPAGALFTDTTYTNGTGLSLSGTQFSINNTVMNDIALGKEAHEWGDHASVGYLTGFTESDPTVPTWVKSITQANIAEWQGKVNRTGDNMTGNLLITPIGNALPAHEFKIDNAGGRNDYYLRSDNGNTVIRFSSEDNGSYVAAFGPNVGIGNSTGFDFIQMPASNSQLRVGFFATQIPGYMSAILGKGYFGDDLYTAGYNISGNGFLHEGYDSPQAVLVSDGSAAYTEVDIVNDGGELRIQPAEITSSGVAINCTVFKHKLVYIRVRNGNKISLTDPQPGQRFILFNVDSYSSDVEINSGYAGTLDPNTKISLYITNLGENLFYDKGEIYNGGF